MTAAAPPTLPVTIVAHEVDDEGGMERQLSELIKGLLSAGHEVRVISRICELPPHPRLRWVRVPGPFRPFVLGYPLFFALGSLLTWRHRRGVLHTTGAVVVNRADVSTVHFCHAAMGEHADIVRSSRSALHYRLNAAVAAPMSRLAERWCYAPGRTRQLVAVSRGVARELDRHLGTAPDRITVIPNGVDTRRFAPADEGRPSLGRNRRLTALFVGGEWERKGLTTAIEAVAKEPRWRLVVVGEGDMPRFEELAYRSGAEERVEFWGRRRDVEHVYREADAFLLPTAYETFSLVTYEAAASGLPLLVGRVSGVEDVLSDGINGWFITRDPETVAGRLAELADDPHRRLAMGQAARAAAEAFDWAQMVEGYRRLYATAADAGQRPMRS